MMRPDHPTEALPIFGEVARGFDAAMRGYDRAQVDRYVAAAEDDLRRANAERDAARAQNADLHRRLEQALAELDSLRQQLRLTAERVSAVTSCLLSSSNGSRNLPIAPVPPVTRIFILPI